MTTRRRRPGAVRTQRRAHRPRRRQRPRGGARRRRARGAERPPPWCPTPARPSSRGTTRRAPGPSSTSSTRRPRRPSGTPRPTSPWHIEVDQEPVVIGQRRGQPRRRALGRARTTPAPCSRSGTTSRLAAVRGGEPELAALPVHARRAGGPPVHGQDRRDGAVDRRQVLRRHPGDGRGPARGGLLQVPRREAVGPLPDQRPPRPAAGRHHRRLPLGHDLPRHADHGGGAGPGRVRLHPRDDHRAAAEAAPPLRHGRRGPPRGLRGAQPAGVLRRAVARPSCASARSSPSRRPCG